MTCEADRREVLLGSAACAVAAAMPFAPGDAAVAAVNPSPLPTPAWAVGMPGEMNWQHIVAVTESEAKLLWAVEYADGNECNAEEEGISSEDCDCVFCSALRECEATRQPKWDGKKNLGNADWLAVGMCSYCDRCGYDTDREFSGGQIIGSEAVCEDCMTIDDWEKIDPEYAAELRENG